MKLAFYIQFLFCLLCVHVSAQCLSEEERIIQKFDLAANNENASEIARNLYICYRKERNQDSARVYATKIIDIGKNRNNLKIWLEGYYHLANVQVSSLDRDSAIHSFNLVLKETESSTDKEELKIRAKTFLRIGALYKDHNLGNEEAFSYFRKAIEVSEQVSHTEVYVRSTVAIIDDMFARKDYNAIPELLDGAYKFLGENEVESFTYRTLDKAKANYLAIKATTEVEKREAMEFMLKEYVKADSLNNQKHRVFIFIDIVKHFLSEMPKEELTAMAEFNFRIAGEKLKGSAKGGLYEAYAKVLMKNQQFYEAIPLLKKAKKHLIKTPNLENYMGVCEDLMLAYEKTDQLEKVLPEFIDYKIFQDSFVATVYSNQLVDLQEKYKTEKKEKENAQLMAQNEVINTRFRFSSIIGILLLLLLFTGIFLFQKLKRNKKDLEKMNEEKNKLFAILAHDLRNPISSLNNLAGKVKFLTKHNRLSDLDELAENTDSKLSALNDNLNNILLWAITESNLVEVKQIRVSLRGEINKINELYNDLIDEKKIIIKNNISDSLQVFADVTVIQTILRNLISNAIKFSHVGGVIEFITTDDVLGIKELKVIDHGIGLQDNLRSQESITNSTLRKKAEGTGIGLKICKELAAKSNLELSLVANPDGGTIGIIRFRQVA